MNTMINNEAKFSNAIYCKHDLITGFKLAIYELYFAPS